MPSFGVVQAHRTSSNHFSTGAYALVWGGSCTSNLKTNHTGWERERGENRSTLHTTCTTNTITVHHMCRQAWRGLSYAFRGGSTRPNLSLWTSLQGNQGVQCYGLNSSGTANLFEPAQITPSHR